MNNAFVQLAKQIEDNGNIVIDDETGEEIKLDGIGHLIQNKREHAVALFKDRDFYLRGLYPADDGKVHLDIATTGGAIYQVETPDLVDLQHHKVSYGTLFQTWMFGLKDGGCNPRPAPEEQPKKEVKKDEGKDKKKDDDKKQPSYNSRTHHSTSLRMAA
jgi:hypothetical protein